MSEQLESGDNFTRRNNPLGFRAVSATVLGEAPEPDFTENEFVAAVIGAVAHAAGVTHEAIAGDSQYRKVAGARHCAAFLLRTLDYGKRYRVENDHRQPGWTGLSYPKIGKHLRRDHTTIQYAVERFGYKITAPGHIREKDMYAAAGEQLLKMGVI